MVKCCFRIFPQIASYLHTILFSQIQDPSANPELQSGSGYIRDSNKATLTALLSGENGFPVVDCGIARDDVHILLDKLKMALSAADVLVSSLFN